MSYKTVLVHVDDSERSQERIRIATSIALAEKAYLIGASATGVSKLLAHGSILNNKDQNLRKFIAASKDRAINSLSAVAPIAEDAGLKTYETEVIDDEAGGGLSLRARYCDLVVLGQTNPDERNVEDSTNLPEYVLMNSGRPVLIVPYVGRFEKVGKRILISWDASREATRAVTDAIPLLKHADLVQVVVFMTNENSSAHGEQPGADIALYLARHGVNVEVSQQRTELDIGNALLSHATDFGADMIVMGGYGHSRFREMLLGGATRTVLETMTVPVFMAH